MGAAADDLSALFDGSGFDAAWAEGARDLERRVAMATVVDEERGMTGPCGGRPRARWNGISSGSWS